MFAAVVGGTMLTAGIPAANASVGVPRAPAVSQGRVVDRTCQARSGGVRTCEWLYEWVHNNLGNPKDQTTGIQAYASMNGSTHKTIVQIQTWAKRCNSPISYICPPHEVQVITGPAGTGYIQNHTSGIYCYGGSAGGVQSRLIYRYLLKPANKWVSGVAYGAWQYLPKPCHEP